MRKRVAVLLVVMVALAGCSGGDSGATPTAERTANGTAADEMNETITEAGTETMTQTGTETVDGPADNGTAFENRSLEPAGDGINSVPGVSGGEVTNITALSVAYGPMVVQSPAEFEIGLNTPEESVTYTYTNDSQAQLSVLSSPNWTEQVTYYVSGDSYAKQNSTSGEIMYGGNESGLSFEYYVTNALLLRHYTYITVLDWEIAGRTTHDGETAYVLQSDELNETALSNDETVTGSLANATSATGEIVVSADGHIHEATIETESPDSGSRIQFTLSKNDSITVAQPDWYEESEAAAASDGEQ